MALLLLILILINAVLPAAVRRPLIPRHLRPYYKTNNTSLAYEYTFKHPCCLHSACDATKKQYDIIRTYEYRSTGSLSAPCTNLLRRENTIFCAKHATTGHRSVPSARAINRHHTTPSGHQPARHHPNQSDTKPTQPVRHQPPRPPFNSRQASRRASGYEHVGKS